MSLQTDPRSPERGQYGFLQDLVRHVAYETISRRERRTQAPRRRRATSEAASVDEDEIAEVIASHYVDAYEAAPDADDADEIQRAAREHGSRARASAPRRSPQPAEAQRYFEQAAGLADEPAAQAALLDRAAQAAWRANEPVATRALLERAHSLYEACDDTPAAALVSARLSEVDFNEGHAQRAVAVSSPRSRRSPPGSRTRTSPWWLHSSVGSSS